MNKLTLLAVIACAFGIVAAKSPKHFSLRAESMGGAHVAVVDDKEAIHYNYAGLTQINRLGNYEIRPEQGYYPRNWIGDMRLTFGGAGDIFKFLSTYSDVKDVQDLFRSAQNEANTITFNHPQITSKTNAILDSLVKNPKYVKIINSYDHKTMEARVKFDAEMAFHNFGAAFWMNGAVAPYIDAGLILPYVVVDTFVIDAVAQMGGALEIIPNTLSVGFGGKIAKRHKTNMVTVGLANYTTIVDTLKDQLGDATDDFFDSKTFSFGLDLGVLYQFNREVRFGASLRDIYFKSLAGETLIPNFTMGVNYSPKFMNSNTGYGRKFNLAMDFADMFNNENNYKFFTHLNFGFELEQNLVAFPGLNNEIRFIALRIAGGFRGGYPSAGVGLEVLRFFSIEAATWGEERGYYTGQDENRIYMVQASIGF
jgi:hypothetical protein